jgi:siroheme synthase
LQRHGRGGDTPAALVHSGTTEAQDWTVAPLRQIPQLVAGFKPPTLLVVGDVVRLAQRAWSAAAAGQLLLRDAAEPCAPVAA